jgi:hypothetical protein
MASFQDRAQHSVAQLDKEVSFLSCQVPGSRAEICLFVCGACVPHANNTLANAQLSKYPVLNNLERQSSVPKVYAILGLAGVYFFLVFFNIAGEFLVNFAGFLIPGYYSLQALFSPGNRDDSQVSLPNVFANGWFADVMTPVVDGMCWTCCSCDAAMGPSLPRLVPVLRGFYVLTSCDDSTGWCMLS